LTVSYDISYIIRSGLYVQFLPEDFRQFQPLARPSQFSFWHHKNYPGSRKATIPLPLPLLSFSLSLSLLYPKSAQFPPQNTMRASPLYARLWPFLVSILSIRNIRLLWNLTTTTEHGNDSSVVPWDRSGCGLQHGAPSFCSISPIKTAATSSLDGTMSHNNVILSNSSTRISTTVPVRRKQKSNYKHIKSAWKKLSNETQVIFPNAIRRKYQVQKESDITVAVHLSIHKLNRFLLLSRRWQGPISVSLYIGKSTDVRVFYKFLAAYHKELMQHCTFHILLENTQILDYPHNQLRQVAMDQAETDLVLILDVDFVTTCHGHSQLRQLIWSDTQLLERMRSTLHPTVMVLPAFSRTIRGVSDSNIPTLGNKTLPDTRHAAQSLVRQGTMQVFHGKRFYPGHGPTNYSKWLADEDATATTPTTTTSVRATNVSSSFYSIEYALYFEPYVVAYRENLPHFWTGFRGFGYDKWTFYLEAHCKGLQFAVLRDFFVLHLDHADLGSRIKSNHTTKEMKQFRQHLQHTYEEPLSNMSLPWYLQKKRTSRTKTK
jgi:hypothetical protein